MAMMYVVTIYDVWGFAGFKTLSIVFQCWFHDLRQCQWNYIRPSWPIPAITFVRLDGILMRHGYGQRTFISMLPLFCINRSSLVWLKKAGFSISTNLEDIMCVCQRDNIHLPFSAVQWSFTWISFERATQFGGDRSINVIIVCVAPK